MRFKVDMINEACARTRFPMRDAFPRAAPEVDEEHGEELLDSELACLKIAAILQHWLHVSVEGITRI